MPLLGRRCAPVLAALLLVGCSAATEPTTRSPAATGGPAPIPRAQVTVRPSPKPSPTPTPTPSASTKAQPPRTVVDAGTVTDAKRQTAAGSGSAEIRFQKRGDFAVVVRLDCSRCRGPYSMTEAGRLTPYGRGPAPAEPAYLLRQLVVAPERGALVLTATGDWKLTLLSWNRLKPVSGKQSGRGSAVLYLADSATRFEIACRTADAADSCHVQAYNPAGDSELVGNDDSFTETVKIELPGVVAIRTNGSWTLTP